MLGMDEHGSTQALSQGTDVLVTGRKGTRHVSLMGSDTVSLDVTDTRKRNTQPGLRRSDGPRWTE